MKILELYTQLCEKYHQVNDQQLFWELIKMEIRSTTISFSKGKANAICKDEAQIKQLDELDNIICNSQNLDNTDEILNNMMTLTGNSNINMKIKAKLQFSGLNAAG